MQACFKSVKQSGQTGISGNSIGTGPWNPKKM